MEATLNNFQHLKAETHQFDAECVKLAKDVESDTISIQQVVESLRDYLIDKNPNRRAYGTAILSNILKSLRNDFLTEAQLHFICTFYCDRIKDHHEVIPATLNGIVSLCRQSNLPENASVLLLNALFQHVPCQQQQNEDRLKIYKIFEALLELKKTELQLMGMDFVYGVISSIDGEKMPKNLIFLFNWLPAFLKSVKLGHLVDEMFDVIACYFPVDFRLPAEEANGVTRDALADGLKVCLCSIPEFAESTLSLAIQKLNVTLRVAKLDSLSILIQGCAVFPKDLYIIQSRKIYNIVQNEFYTTNNNEIKELCLKTLTAVTNLIGNDKSPEFMDNFNQFFVNLKANLRVDIKLFIETTQILNALIKSTKTMGILIIEDCMPVLTNLFNITTKMDEKLVILNTIIDFVDSYFNANASANINDCNELQLIPNFFISILLHQERDLKCVALRGIGRTSAFLDAEARMIYNDYLKASFMNCECIELQMALKRSFHRFTNLDEIRALVNVDIMQVKDADYYLTTISEHPLLLLDAITIILGNYEHRPNEFLTTFANILEIHESNAELHEFIAAKEFLNSFLLWFQTRMPQNDELLANVAKIIKILVGFKQEREQILLLDNIMPNIIENYSVNKNFAFISIFDGILCRLRPNLLKNCVIIEDLLNVCLSDARKDVYVHLLANIINKIDNDEIVRNVCNRMENVVSNESEAVNNTLAWIAKALVMRGHELSQKMIDIILNLIKSRTNAAYCIKIILNDECECLSPKNFATRRLLYRQYFFQYFYTSTLFDKSNENYLRAFSYALGELPFTILQLYLKDIIQIIILSMDKCVDVEALQTILNIIKNLIMHKHELSVEYLDEFIPRLSKVIYFKENMNIRIQAIECLALYACGYPMHKLQFHRNDVIVALGGALDDRKRLVRKEAADARLLWYIQNDPI